MEGLDLQAHVASSSFRRFQRGLGIRSVGRIDEHGHASRSGHKLSQELQALRRQFSIKKIDARQVAARPCKADDKTKADWILGEGKNDRDR